MKPVQIREKTDVELKELGDSLRDELFRLRMQHYTGQLESPTRIREVRRDIARVETILRERA